MRVDGSTHRELSWSEFSRTLQLLSDQIVHGCYREYTPTFSVRYKEPCGLMTDRMSEVPKPHTEGCLTELHFSEIGLQCMGAISNSARDLGILGKLESLDESIQAVELMHQKRVSVSRDIIYSLLQGCQKKKDMSAARRVFSLMVSTGLDSTSFLGYHLIRLFVSCGYLLEADQVFFKISKPNVYTWNAIILAHAKLGEAERALELFHKMREVGVSPDKFVFSSILKACSKSGSLEQGNLIYDQIIRSNLESDLVVGNTLVDMYVKCMNLDEARSVFDSLMNRDVISWSAMLAGYAQHGHSHLALDLYEKMQRQGINPGKVAFIFILKACGSIAAIGKGRLMHDKIIRSGLEFDVVIGSTLVDMYAKCKSLLEAQKVFDVLPNRDAVSWGTMITGYTEHGHGDCALELLGSMQMKGINPDKSTFSSALRACGSIGALGQGQLIHSLITSHGLEAELVVGSALVDMYAKNGSLEDAHKVFKGLLHRDVVTYGAIIAGYAQHGQGIHALEIFMKMKKEGIKASKITLLCALKACISIEAIGQGRLIHEHVIKAAPESDKILQSTLVDMYAKCGSLEEAHKVFDDLPKKDLVSWGTLIVGYAQNGLGLPALELFKNMQLNGMNPDKYIFSGTLKACGSIGAVKQGRLIHEQIMKSGLDSEPVVGNALVDMYSKCRDVAEARQVFDKLSSRQMESWGAIIAGYAEHSHGFLALELFNEMQHRGIKPDKLIYSCILKACGSLGATVEGRLIHEQIIRRGLGSDIFVGNTLVDMHAKCGRLEDAHIVFDKLPMRDVVSWSSMIAGYAYYGYGVPALELSEKMQQEGIKPSKVTFLSILKACGITGAVGHGKLIHDQVIRRGLDSDAHLGSTLIDMYAKCGSPKEAHKMLDQLIKPDVVSWGAIVAGYAQYANYKLAWQCLEDMQIQDLKPNDVIFTNILAACSHAGLVEEGSFYFKSMKEDHGITPHIEHYSCMVDLLGRAGHLNEAEDVLQTMPLIPDFIMWMSLLSGCQNCGNLELGNRCFDEVIRVTVENASGYVVIANMYADAQLWDDFNKIQELRKFAGAWKKPGKTWIEIETKVHEFIVRSKDHAQNFEIYAKLNRLSGLTKRKGYVPYLDSVSETMLDHEEDSLQAL